MARLPGNVKTVQMGSRMGWLELGTMLIWNISIIVQEQNRRVSIYTANKDLPWPLFGQNSRSPKSRQQALPFSSAAWLDLPVSVCLS